MAGVKNFTDLQIWRKARRWSKQIFGLTLREPFRFDQRLVIQVNDSSESVAANIAEGFGRGTQADLITFLSYAIGSLNETQSHLCAAYDRGYSTKEEFATLFRNATELRKMTVSFLRSMVLDDSGVKHVKKLRPWSDQVWEIYERVTGKKRPELTVATFSQKASEKARARNEPVAPKTEAKEDEPMSTEYAALKAKHQPLGGGTSPDAYHRLPQSLLSARISKRPARRPKQCSNNERH
jgi:four helix bundle protein